MKTIYTIIGFMLIGTVSFGQEKPETKEPETNSACQCCETKEDEKVKDKKREIDTVLIEFVGDGNIQKSLNDGSGLPANTGIGAIFKRVWLDDTVRINKTVSLNDSVRMSYSVTRKRITSDIEIDFSINVASTVDTIIAEYTDGVLTNGREFGTQVLLPSNSGQAYKISYYHYFNPDNYNVFKVLSGLNVDLSAANRIWKDSLVSNNVTTFSGRWGAYHDFFPKKLRLENNYAIRVGTAFTYRGIVGDVGSSLATDFREGLLGTKQRFYAGFELFGELKFDNIVFGVSMPIIVGNHNVQGLSGAQFITSIAFVGGFPVKIKKGKQTEQKSAK